jgi:malate/lactate dehydrogenase
VLVVGNPANTNALLAATAAPGLPKSAFTALTRLDLNRAKAAIAARLQVVPSAVSGVLIWGNHSTTQFPDARQAQVAGTDATRPHDTASVTGRLAQLEGGTGTEWLRGEFIPYVQNRGKVVMDARGASSAASAAQAICDHMYDWHCGSGGRMVSMGVWTEGAPYGLPDGLIFSLPVVCEGSGATAAKPRPDAAPADEGAPSTASGYRIITDLHLDAFTTAAIVMTTKELVEERELAFA